MDDGILLRLTSLLKYLSAFGSGEIKALQPDRRFIFFVTLFYNWCDYALLSGLLLFNLNQLLFVFKGDNYIVVQELSSGWIIFEITYLMIVSVAIFANNVLNTFMLDYSKVCDGNAPGFKGYVKSILAVFRSQLLLFSNKLIIFLIMLFISYQFS